MGKIRQISTSKIIQHLSRNHAWSMAVRIVAQVMRIWGKSGEFAYQKQFGTIRRLSRNHVWCIVFGLLATFSQRDIPGVRLRIRSGLLNGECSWILKTCVTNAIPERWYKIWCHWVQLFQCKLWELARFLNYDALSAIIRSDRIQLNLVLKVPWRFRFSKSSRILNCFISG